MEHDTHKWLFCFWKGKKHLISDKGMTQKGVMLNGGIQKTSNF